MNIYPQPLPSGKGGVKAEYYWLINLYTLGRSFYCCFERSEKSCLFAQDFSRWSK